MKQQHAAILVLFALGLVQGVATQYPEPFRVPEWLSWSLTIACGLTVYWWYRADSNERGIKRSSWLSILVGVVPIGGVPFYLFRSRGFRLGLSATGVAIAVFLGIILSSAAAAIGVAWLRMSAGEA